MYKLKPKIEFKNCLDFTSDLNKGYFIDYNKLFEEYKITKSFKNINNYIDKNNLGFYVKISKWIEYKPKENTKNGNITHYLVDEIKFFPENKFNECFEY